jgi:hypothetical protein
MKLSYKVRKLAQPLTYQRAWRRTQRTIFPLPLEPILASIDRQRLREYSDAMPARLRNMRNTQISGVGYQ